MPLQCIFPVKELIFAVSSADKISRSHQVASLSIR